MLDIQNVDLNRLQKFFNEKVKAGFCADSINKMKGLLNRFFEYAVKKHYVTVNPVPEVVIKRVVADNADEEKGKALRQEIRQSVLNLVKEDTLLKPIIITFSFSGLRPQELIALKWENVNLTEKTISIKKAVNRVIEFDDNGNVVGRSEVIGKTKSPKSVRSFVIPENVVAVLEEWREYCNTKGIKSDFVFPNTKNGNMRTYSGLRSLLVRFVEKHGLEDEGISLYTFRHTFATILLEERENPRIVADLMGHQKVSTTLDIYSHVMSNSVYQQTAQTLDGVFNRYS
jgi:site-specific recombinase XerD